MVLPGTVLHPKDVQVGALLQARDPAGLWYNAKVIHKSGRGASVAATVHYIGFGPAEDEKFTARKAGLRVRLPAAALRAEQTRMVEENRVQELYDGRTDGRREDGTWEIERLLAVRTCRGKREYHVRWLGWGPDYDTWESVNLEKEIIEEYEEEQAEVTKAKLHPPPVPYAVALAEAEDESIRELRITDAEELLADMATETGDKVKNQQVPAAEKKVYVVKPVSAPAFYAIREKLARWAKAEQPERPVEEAVEKIKTYRGGKRPVNSFGVLDSSIVNKLLGAAAFKIHANGTATKIVAPLDFFLKARKDELTGELLPVKELTIKVHVATLVENHESPQQPRFRLDFNAFAYPDGDEHACRQAMAEALLRRQLAGGAVSDEFAAWAHVVLPGGLS